MTRNKLLRRLEALEEIIKPQASEEIPPAAKEMFARVMADRRPESNTQASNTPGGGNHEK